MSEPLPELEALIDGALDGDAAAAARLRERLHHDPAALAEYAAQMRLHALLTWKHGRASTAPVRPAMAARRWMGIAAAVAAVIGLFVVMTPRSAPAAAAAALDRMLAVARRGGDRTYVFSVLAGSRGIPVKGGVVSFVDGARLHLGAGSEFVYDSPLSNGSRRLTGSDGRSSWEQWGDAAPRVSSDPGYFRHHIPGEREHFTLLDPAAGLALLRDGYEVTLDDSGGSIQRLKAVKRRREFRGPREARVAFEKDSGTIVEMEFEGLPQARGGPSAVRLTLESREAHPSGFFSPDHHH
jgi:hypothetical protein